MCVRLGVGSVYCKNWLLLTLVQWVKTKNVFKTKKSNEKKN